MVYVKNLREQDNGRVKILKILFYRGTIQRWNMIKGYYGKLKWLYQIIFQYWKWLETWQKKRCRKERRYVGIYPTRLNWYCYTGNGEFQYREGHRDIQKESMKANIHISFSIIEVANLNVGCFLITIGYYTLHKTTNIQFGNFNNGEADMNVSLHRFFLNVTMSFSILKFSIACVTISIESCWIYSDMSAFFTTYFLLPCFLLFSILKKLSDILI